MQEPCKSCARREQDFGGCRCQAFLIAGDARAADPVCHLSPHHALVEQLAAVREDMRLQLPSHPDHGELPDPPIATAGSNVGDLRRWGRAPGPFSIGPRELSASASGRTSMIPCVTARRSILLAGTIAGLLLAAPAFAQQPACSLRRRAAAPRLPAAARAAARLAADRPPRGQRGCRQARAGRRAAAAGRRRQAADRQAQAAARLQHRGLCQRHRQCALAARRRQGHRVRRHPLRQQGHRRRQEGRQDRDQDDRRRPLSSERSRLSQRHALHRRAVADFQDRQRRGQSRQGERSRR